MRRVTRLAARRVDEIDEAKAREKELYDEVRQLWQQIDDAAK